MPLARLERTREAYDDSRDTMTMISVGRIGETFTIRFLWCSVCGWVNERFAWKHRNNHALMNQDRG
jgi:hypothetical protein